jgi:anti-anti-sigma factor
MYGMGTTEGPAVALAAHEPLSATVRKEGEVGSSSPTVRLDATTAWRLDRYVDAALEAGEHHVVLDLEHVAFIDSAGIGAIVGAFRRLRATGGALGLISPSVVAEHTLEFAGITRLVKDRQRSELPCTAARVAEHLDP